MRLTRFASFVVLLAACGTGGPRQTDPVTGETYRSPVGNDFASQDRWIRDSRITELRIAQDGGVLPEPGITAACDAVFSQIVATLPPQHRRGFSYTLVLAASPQVNAYTYGGGRVHCFLGAVAACEDASEFAGLVAHEIGHISHDHFGQRAGRARRARSILGLGGLLGRPGRAIGGLLGGWAAGIKLQRYSRVQEKEADERAVEYTSAAAFDPDGLARWFARLEQQGRARGVSLFASHPTHKNRVREIRAAIARRQENVGTTSRTVRDVRDTDGFRRARDRARAILPYYVGLETALAGTEPAPVIKACDKGMAALPNHGTFYFWKGLLLAAQDDRKQRAVAVPLLRRAALLDDANFTVHLIRSMTELAAGQFPQAEQAATRVIELVPFFPNPHFIRGVARFALDRKQEAFGDFDATLERLPQDQRAETVKKIREFAPEYRKDDA